MTKLIALHIHVRDFGTKTKVLTIFLQNRIEKIKNIAKTSSKTIFGMHR